MKLFVLIKYSTIFLILFLLSCEQQKSQKGWTDSTDITHKIDYRREEQVIVKNGDSISLKRFYATVQDRFIDTIFIKQDTQKLQIFFPSINDYDVELKERIPHKKIYNFSENKFTIQANYKHVIIQYIFGDNINKLEGIFIITDIDDIFPDFNKSIKDTIAKIQYIDVDLELPEIDEYLDNFSKSFIDEQLKIDSTYYIIRKEGITDYIY